MKQQRKKKTKTRQTSSVQKQIEVELRDPLCIDADSVLGVGSFRDLFKWSEPFEPLDSKASALLDLRLTQLEIDVSEDEYFELQEILGIGFGLKVVSNISFKEIAKLSKQKLLGALAELRK
jgi:hypothetical protein